MKYYTILLAATAFSATARIDNPKSGEYLPDFKATLTHKIIACKSAKDYRLFNKARFGDMGEDNADMSNLKVDKDAIAYLYTTQNCITVDAGYKYRALGWENDSNLYGYKIELFSDGKTYKLWTNGSVAYQATGQEYDEYHKQQLEKNKESGELDWLKEKFEK